MEQDIKVGAAGSVHAKEEIAGESLKGSLPVGPLSVAIEIEIDNAKLLALVASKVPGGLAHDAVIALQKALFPSA